MAVTSNEGDQPGLQPYEESTLEKKTNLAEAERRKALKRAGLDKQPYPKMLHKPGGLTQIVQDAAEHAKKTAAGWYDDVREVPVSAPTTAPTKVSEMTLEQAEAFIATATPGELAAIEADEVSHGHRAKVMKVIEAAKDAVGGAKPSKPSPKASKPAPKRKTKG